MSNPARLLELPRHPFRSIQQAAAELRQAAVSTGATPLYLLPFNRYAPEDTEWWLAPAPDNPAYKHAKIVLMAGEGSAPGDLFVGLSFEKGIGSSAAEFFTQTAQGRRRVADRTWAWERELMPALHSGALEEASEKAEATAGVSLTVFMGAIYLQPTRDWDDLEDVRSMDWPRDVVRLECAGGRLSLIDEEMNADLLGGMGQANTFAEVASILDGMPKADWAWVDFAIGVRLSRSADSGPPEWRAEDIWRRVCEPWAGWIG